MSNELIPQYSTVIFTDIWDNAADFLADFNDNGIIDAQNPPITTTSAQTLFYLLYARYGNNPIANLDIEQWKYKIFSIIFQYGPSWEKRLSIQSALRGLTEADLLSGSRAIYNTALNPSTAPSTASNEELTYINSQNTTNYKKSKMEAYAQLWDLLETDVTEEFLLKFKKCFKIFVSAEQPMLFVSDEEED